MNTNNLQTKIKPIQTVYLYWLLFGVHYVYFGKWGTQLLYWFSAGGLGIRMIIDFVRMPEMIVAHRESVFRKMEELENAGRHKKNNQIWLKPVQKYKLAMVG
jgi:hypothetical protein